MIDELMGAYGSRLLIAVAGVGLALILLIVILWLVRRRGGPSPFIRGGKNRAPRLQVLDAAAVDTRRRIVLIRRDDVEHLVMIGGPTDIVIESGIQPDGTLRAPRALSFEATPPESTAQDAAAAPSEPPRVAERPRPAAVAAPAQPAAIAATRQEPMNIKVEPRSSAETAGTPAVARPAPQEKTAALETAPPVARTAIAQPVPVAAAPDPLPSQKREAAGIRPVPQPATPEVLPQPRQVESPTLAKPVDATLGSASDALDEARRRVYQTAATAAAQPKPAIAAHPQPQTTSTKPQRTEPEITVAAPPAPVSAAAQIAPTGPTRTLGTDFERILEEEMANNLAAARQPSEPVAAPSLPTRDPLQPRVTGASPEPSLQNEVARIFGEMSVTRNDRN